ncbi:MAG TPA: hypothetical protein VIG33_10210 [Pseudobdellovibrionaceae bacterium]
MQQQLAHFSEQLKIYFNTPKMLFTSWTEAFAELNRHVSSKSCLIFLDEISWMSSGADTFSSELKASWDMLFKKKNKLVFVIAGSVSSWIEENILQNSNFLGRVTLNLRLDELPLSDFGKFWRSRGSTISTFNLVKTGTVFGGVPLYLELQNPQESVEQNLNRLCFKKSGPLVEEFDKIFSDIFSRRGPIYKRIVGALILRPMTHSEIAKALGTEKSGALSKYLADLVQSGFLSADTTYDFKGAPTKLVQYRVCDNYTRFALKYIEPNKKKILEGSFHFGSLEGLPGWSSIFGLQFENLILKNKNLILNRLQVDQSKVLACSPFVQRKTNKNKGGCQIDLLIVLKNYHIYLCEIKLQAKISNQVIEDIKQKMAVLKRPKIYTLQPVLIYGGELSHKVKSSEDWLRLISIEDLFE